MSQPKEMQKKQKTVSYLFYNMVSKDNLSISKLLNILKITKKLHSINLNITCTFFNT